MNSWERSAYFSVRNAIPCSMTRFLPTLFFCFAATGLLAQHPQLTADSTAPTPQLFAPGLVSGPFLERDLALTPTGDELYFTIQGLNGELSVILVSRKQGDTWSRPEVAPFSGAYADLEPFLTADGNRLYFSSKRPKTPGGPVPADFDLWYTDRQAGGWGEPVRLDGPVNTEKDEFYPTLSRNGNLYFTASYAGGVGGEDIWVSRWQNGQFQKPEALPEAVNSKGHEFNAFVDPDERFLLFTAYGRADGLGRGDLYVAHRDAAGTWQPARMLPAPINSPALDYCPYVSPDGKWFFFASKRTLPTAASHQTLTAQSLRERLNAPGNGLEDIYRVEAAAIWRLAK